MEHTLLLLLLLQTCEMAQGTIHFMTEPQSVTGFPRENVTFHCVPSTRILPSWVINGTQFYHWRTLEEIGYIVGNGYLTIPNIRLRDNSTTLQCAVVNQTHVTRSNIATLTVMKGSVLDHITPAVSNNSICFNMSSIEIVEINFLLVNLTVIFSGQVQTSSHNISSGDCLNITYSKPHLESTLKIDIMADRDDVNSPGRNYCYSITQLGYMDYCDFATTTATTTVQSTDPAISLEVETVIIVMGIASLIAILLAATIVTVILIMRCTHYFGKKSRRVQLL